MFVQSSLLASYSINPYLHAHTHTRCCEERKICNTFKVKTSRRERGIWSADPDLFPSQPHVFPSLSLARSLYCRPGLCHDENGSDPTHYQCWSFSTKAEIRSAHIICRISTNIPTTSKKNQDTCGEKKQLIECNLSKMKR